MKVTKVAIALAAMLAMSGLVASAASAAQYKSNSSPVMLFGEDTGNHKLTVDGQAVTCNKVVFEKASLETPANEINGITAAYNGCTAFGFANATVNMGNCTYTFKQPTVMNEHEDTVTIGLLCSGANNMNINSSVFGSECSVSIGQSGNDDLVHAGLIIDTMPKRITVNFTIGLIKAVKNKDNGLCPLSGTGTVNNGTYNGLLTLEGTEGIGVYVE